MALGVTLWCNDHYVLRNFGAKHDYLSATHLSAPCRPLYRGRLVAGLGRLSFPLYLVHTLVICSVSSIVYVVTGSIAATAV